MKPRADLEIRVSSTTDAGEALDRLGGYLAGDRITHELVIASLLVSRRSARGVRAWWAHRQSQILGVVVQAGTSAQVSRLELDAVAPLAEAVAEAGDPRPASISGPTADLARLSAEYGAAARRSGNVGRATRAMEISSVAYPPAPAGVRRLARPDDLDLIVGWLKDFDGETGGPGDPDFNRALGANYIERSQLHLWETAKGPVASTAVFAPDPAVARLVFVYTPLEHRAQGFASRLVAEVAQATLDAGNRCILFADRANSTSTAIYERIGFVPVADFVQYEFQPSASRGR